MRNAALICLGYWGSFQYFLLNEDYRNAAIQVYEANAVMLIARPASLPWWSAARFGTAP